MWFTTLEKIQSVSDYQQHQLLWTFFKEQQGAGESRPFCYRDTGTQILMLSSVKPNCESREIHFTDGQHLMFECRASINARRYKTVTYKPQDYTAEQKRDWFRRKFEHAATIDFVTFKSFAPHVVLNNSNHKIVLNQTAFFGTLTISDAAKFESIVSTGIGEGKAFGFGMLLLPQVMK